jgi:hypothetical protein
MISYRPNDSMRISNKGANDEALFFVKWGQVDALLVMQLLQGVQFLLPCEFFCR